MTPQVIAFYAIGGVVCFIGLIIGCFGGFNSDAWWPIIVGAVICLVGVLVQFKIIDPPFKMFSGKA